MKKLNYLMGTTLASVLMLANFTMMQSNSAEREIVGKEEGWGHCKKCGCESF